VSEKQPDTPTALAAIRTHLANERTFAAWVRTGLSIDAAGIGVARAHPGTSTRWLAVTLILLGSGMIVFGGARFGRVAGDLSDAGSPPVYITRHVVYAIVALLAILVVCTYLVVV
jgi:putative membrane protein